MNNKIMIVGAGYVGTSLAVLLSQKNHVTIIDVDERKLELLDQKKSPIKDNMINELFKNQLNLKTSTNLIQALSSGDIDLAILCLPTNYNTDTNCFDTSILENTIDEIVLAYKDIPIIIKSTVPIGFTKKMQIKYAKPDIIFSPEFLREGFAIHDNLYPSRIVIGNKNNEGIKVGKLFSSISINSPKINTMHSTEAEAVKLFANSYLATRVTFFNELDSFCIKNDLDSRSVIEAISDDPRIGDGYNNPSFGYGGYCLPKDTKQLLANFADIPQGIFTAVVEGNEKRKMFIAKLVIQSKPKIVGVYRLTMKSGSDNFRESAIFDVMKILEKEKVEIIIYEPILESCKYHNWQVTNNLDEFKTKANIVLANRMHDEIRDVKNKVFTRDIFEEN